MSTSHDVAPLVDPSTVRHGPARRLVGPDVTRAVALIGVVVMNYHGYLNGSSAAAQPGSSFLQRLFDPWNGVLATRFAATFMVVAGVGITLLTARSRASGDRAAVSDDRWRLVRRGVVLYAIGFVLDWVWPGTILFFYGAAFVLAALVFTLRTRWLVVIGAGAAVAAAGVHWWAAERRANGHSVNWLISPGTLTTESPRGLVFDTFVNGTHPLLPWFGFLCLGMIVGRSLGAVHPLRMAGIGLSVTFATYLVNHIATSGHADDRVLVTVLSTRPFDRGLLYTLGAAGTAVAAFGVVTWLAERDRDATVVQVLARAGQMTLTLYLAHVLVFNLVVDWLGWLGGTGLDASLGFAAAFWVVAIAVGSWWRRLIGIGPAEWVYRKFGG
ncbi:MAG: DUF418 domain-containing protein [Actinobacteria bacterium]|nr:DUF418 domain-containing protein [Actinomycetota bacterium]